MDRNRDPELPLKRARTSSLNSLFEREAAFAAGKARASSYVRIGMEIRALREKAGLTQQLLALQTGLDQAEISRLETGIWGNRGISFDVLGRVLPVFGLRIAHEVRVTENTGPTDNAQLESARALTEWFHASL